MYVCVCRVCMCLCVVCVCVFVCVYVFVCMPMCAGSLAHQPQPLHCHSNVKVGASPWDSVQV